MWSPSGLRIAFIGSQDSVWVANSNGRALKRLTPGRISAQSLAWAPDGTRIAFERFNLGIYTVSVKGTSLRELVTDAEAGDPYWQPLPQKHPASS